VSREGLPRSDKNPVRIIVIAIALIAASLILWQLAAVFAVGFGGVVVATLLRAIAEPFGRIPGVGPRSRIALAIATFLILLGVVSWLFGRQVAAQAAEMQQLLPQQFHRVLDSANSTPLGQRAVEALKKSLADAHFIGGIGLAAATLGAALLDAVLILFMGIFFAFHPEVYLNGGLRLLPPPRRRDVRAALVDAGTSLRSWLLGQLISMAVIGILAGTAYAIIGVPAPLALGCLAALFEFIPVAGPIGFGVIGMLVAFSRGPTLALYAVMVFVCLQQIESNIIIPLVQRWAVRMPPVVTVLSVLAGGVLLGPIGVIFAVPMAVVTLTLLKHLYVEEALES
jgi:predicted PurR-regulated permease PerM